MKAPRQIIDVGVVGSFFPSALLLTKLTFDHFRFEARRAPSLRAAVLHQEQSPRGQERITSRCGSLYSFFQMRFETTLTLFQVLIQIEGLYLALLNLESDQLKLHALPTGAPLREQVNFFPQYPR